MSGIDFFALLLLVVMAVAAFGLLYFLGSWPGRVAHGSNHPDARAIEIGGWATLIFGGLFWPLVLIWAYRSPARSNPPEPSTTL